MNSIATLPFEDDVFELNIPSSPAETKEQVCKLLGSLRKELKDRPTGMPLGPAMTIARYNNAVQKINKIGQEGRFRALSRFMIREATVLRNLLLAGGAEPYSEEVDADQGTLPISVQDFMDFSQEHLPMAGEEELDVDIGAVTCRFKWRIQKYEGNWVFLLSYRFTVNLLKVKESSRDFVLTRATVRAANNGDEHAASLVRRWATNRISEGATSDQVAEELGALIG